MINIRKTIFETNSSATHCVTLLTEDEYDKFVDGESFLDFDKGIIYTKDEAFKIARSKSDYTENMTDEGIEDLLADYKIYNWHTWYTYIEDEEYTDTDEFTKNGQKYIVLAHYYWD